MYHSKNRLKILQLSSDDLAHSSEALAVLTLPFVRSRLPPLNTAKVFDFARSGVFF